MNSYIIEIIPKKAEYDPLASTIQAELIEAGEPPKTAVVQTRRLYKIQGNIDKKKMEEVAQTLLVDPIIESANVEDLSPSLKPKKVPKPKPGWVLDIWPKPGVTDPVGETVKKGLHDLGLRESFEATSAQRFIFPKAKDERLIKQLAERVLANQLIHDIYIRTNI